MIDKLQYWQPLAAKQVQIIRIQWGIVSLCALSTLAATAGWLSASSTLFVSVPPSLPYGGLIQVGRKHPTELYSFAGYISQQLGTWSANGQHDSYNNLQRLEPFLTERFITAYQKHLRLLATRGELEGRTRVIVPTGEYQSSQVATVTGGWHIRIEQVITEYLAGVKLKSSKFLLEVAIVVSDTNPELNPWRLAIDSMVVLEKTEAKISSVR